MMKETSGLTITEIIAELKKMGINTQQDLHACLSEYENYALRNACAICSAGTHPVDSKRTVEKRVK